MSGAGNWLFEELDAAAREFEAMPDEYKPIITGSGFLRDDGKFPGRIYGGNGQAGPGDELDIPADGYCTCYPDMWARDCGVELHRRKARGEL